jgi:hypothetical protein
MTDVRRQAGTMEAVARLAALGAIAQLGERLDRTQEVVGSSPTSSTLVWTGTAAQFPWADR